MRKGRGWEFSSVEEGLPGKCKALSSVPSTEKKKGKNRKKNEEGEQNDLSPASSHKAINSSVITS
jgi:hypothetical protein